MSTIKEFGELRFNELGKRSVYNEALNVLYF